MALEREDMERRRQKREAARRRQQQRRRRMLLLTVCALVVLVGCRIAHCSQLATGVAVVLAGMPMGGTTAILAEKYGADSTFASKCTAISTVLSLLTTPLWCLMV